jgi:YVTN family beta-propeller protein
MKFSHLAAMACALLLCVLIAGCGDVFRPVATPLPQPSADPQTSRIAVFTSCQYVAGACSSSGVVGTASDVDVSGDSLDAVVRVGRSPRFALVEGSGSTIVTVFTADFDNDTVTEHTDSHLTSAAAPSVSTASTVGLPAGAQPISLVNANGTTYVAEFGRDVVGVLGGSPLALTTEIPVGAQPVNLTVLPNGKEIYAVNRSDNTVTVISTADTTPVATIAVGSTPVWAVPSADSLHVYVVNQGSGTVSVIDATSHTLTKTLMVGTSPNYAVFDTHNLRVLVTNPGSNSLSVIAADSTSPAFLTLTSVAVGTAPSSVTALADGTRVYVANTGSNSISVINSLSLTVTKTISLITTADPTPSPVWISSDDESAKVLTANRDSGDVSVINTSTDSEVTDSTTGLPHRLLAPQIDPSCVPTTPNSCPRLNPVFIAVSAG